MSSENNNVKPDEAGPVKEQAVTVPMGSDAVAGGGDAVPPVRGLTIAIIVLDSLALVFWLISWAVPFLSYVGLACFVVGCVLAFVIPCKVNRSVHDARSKSKCRGVFHSHLVTLIFYVLAIILVVIAMTTGVAGLAYAGLAFSIISLIGLIVSLSLAGVLLCHVNAATRN